MFYGDLGKRGFKDFKGKQIGREVHTHPVILKDFFPGYGFIDYHRFGNMEGDVFKGEMWLTDFKWGFRFIVSTRFYEVLQVLQVFKGF